MAQLFTNNAISELFAPIAASDTVMDITPGDQSLFPTITGGSGDFFMNTIEVGSLREVVKVIATNNNTFTIVRAQEGTTATGWSASSTVALRVTAGQLGELFPVDVSSNATGTLPVKLGGTGQASYTIGDLIIATAAQILGTVGIGAANSILISNGTVPTYTQDPIVTTLAALNALITGSAPAATGQVRLSNTDTITSRNSTDDGDKVLMRVDGSDNTILGEASESVSLPNEATLSGLNASETVLFDLFKLDVNNLWRLLQTPILNNDLPYSSVDSANTVQIPLVKVDSNNDIIFGDGLNRDMGFGKIDPKARHDFAGSVAFPTREVTSNATFGDDFLIVGDTDSGNITLNLPPIADALGRLYAAKHIGATNTLTLEPNASETIDGATNIGLTANNEVRVFIATSSEWKLIVGA